MNKFEQVSGDDPPDVTTGGGYVQIEDGFPGGAYV